MPLASDINWSFFGSCRHPPYIHKYARQKPFVRTFFKMLCESVWWHVSHPAKTYQAWAQRQAKVSLKMKWCLEVPQELRSALTVKVSRKDGRIKKNRTHSCMKTRAETYSLISVTSTSCHVIVVCMKSNFIQRWRQWDSLTKLLPFCSDVHHSLKRAFLFLSQPIVSPYHL